RIEPQSHRGSLCLLRKCDRLLTPRTCQAAIAPTTINAKAAEAAKLSTCKRESRDQLSRGSGRRRRRDATPTGGLGPGNECPESYGHAFPDPNRLWLSAGCAGPPVAGRSCGSLRDLSGLWTLQG